MPISILVGIAVAAGIRPLELRPCHVEGTAEELRCGTLVVPENRAQPRGRTLALRVVVVPSRAAKRGEPIFFLSGGPGQAATAQAADMVDSWEREEHDLVLFDLRGTSEGTGLDCPVASDDDLQSYLRPLFSEGAQAYRACRAELEKRADLTQYTTPIAMQDLDELRQRLGYDRIDLEGGSYGTRAALTYLHMYGAHVRSALLTGLAPIANRLPLYHAAAAQRAFDELVAQCTAEPPCRAAYPDPHADLRAIIEALRKQPARVQVRHPVTSVPTDLLLTEAAFGDGLRVMLYSSERGRRVPLLLQRARAGEFTPFAEAALESSRGVRKSLRLGLTLSVSCPEDVARIRPDEVDRETGDSFIGSWRVRGQMEACSVWPKAKVPADYFRPFQSEVPTVLISGNLDPVTPPRWGEEARRSLPRSIHVVLPGGHAENNGCVASIATQLFRMGSVSGIDTSCVKGLSNPPFGLPVQQVQ